MTLPLLTVLAMATQDLISAVIVIVTLPLVPVFAALVGWKTQQRAPAPVARDVHPGRPFPRRRQGAADAGCVPAGRRPDAYESATSPIGTDVPPWTRCGSRSRPRRCWSCSPRSRLRWSPSRSVCGLRSGDLDLQTALVVLLLAPEAYWPLRRIGAEFHAAAEGGATLREVAAVLDDPEPQPGVGSPGSDPRCRSPSQASVSRTRAALRPGARPARRDDCAAQHRRDRGPLGVGQVHPAAGAARRPRLRGFGRIGDRPLVDIDAAAWAARLRGSRSGPGSWPGRLPTTSAIARPEATDEQVRAALLRVGLGHVVSAAPDGIDHSIGEDGRGLSAGERARLALARAVIAERPLVLLDEPTAHLDEADRTIVLATIEWLARRSHGRGGRPPRRDRRSHRDLRSACPGPPSRTSTPGTADERRARRRRPPAAPARRNPEDRRACPTRRGADGRRLIWGITLGCLASPLASPSPRRPGG